MNNKLIVASKYLPVSLLTLALTLPILVVEAGRYDVQHHLQYAYKILQGGAVTVPHFLFHVAAVFAHQVLRLDWSNAAVLVQAGFCLGAALVAFHHLHVTRRYGLVAATAASLALQVVNPITLGYLLDKRLYFGYLYSNTYHNPTILALKPFALGVLLLAVLLLGGAKERSWPWGLAAAGAAVLGCLGKPSLAIALLPALVMLCALRWALRLPVAARNALWIIVPTLLCLAWQYQFTFGATAPKGTVLTQGGIILEPLAVMGLFSQHLALKALLSVAFPLLLSVLFWPQLKERLAWQLAWLAFLCGSGYAYLLNESGTRANQGNFLWSAQITLFLLYFVCLAEFIGLARTGPKRWWACAVVLALHILCGLVFYATELTARQMSFW